jgi:hypothetical protein
MMAFTLASAEQASAQTADVAGAWTLTVSTDNGITNPLLTLVQDGESLTGHYSSEALGENDIRGMVDGSTVTIRFSADLQGQSVPVVYSGTVDAEGKMSGSLDIADGMLGGTFTGTR